MREEVPAWPPGASRSTTMVRRPSEAPSPAAARPDGPAPTTTLSYSAAPASFQPRSSATRRSWGLITVLPFSKRMMGQSPSSGNGPAPHCSAASGASGATHRSRPGCAPGSGGADALGVRPLAEHDRARRTVLGREALQAVRPGHAVRGQLAHLCGHLGCRGGDLVVVARLEAPTRDGSAARNPTGYAVPITMDTSPKMSPGARCPSTLSTPSTALTASIRPSSTAYRDGSSPSCAAYSPGCKATSAAPVQDVTCSPHRVRRTP